VSWLLAFLGFSALIMLHEFGHFAVAKLTGMRVERFALFFPPLIVRKQIGETEYAIGAMPIGGYVKITGMNPEEDLPPDVAPRAYYNQPVWKRVVVIMAGPAMNLLIAFFIFFGLAFGTSKDSTKVFAIADNGAAQGTLQKGDRILSVDGQTGKRGDVKEQLNTFRHEIGSHKCAGKPVQGCRAVTPAVFRVERNGRVVTVAIRPRYDAAAKRTLVGVAFGEPRHPNVLAAAKISVDEMWFITKATATTFAQLFKAEKRKEISGVVGSYEVTRQSFAHDVRQALLVLGLISLSLALFNLLPFLPLDGGHVFWSLVEKLRGGRPVPMRVIEQASVIGIMLVAVLFVIGFSNDVGRLTGGGFNTR
jgi:regulator of sigma E protease